MALAPGTRLGPYEIVSPLGAGGMGEVYRARDTRLGRDVALKILPPDVAGDPSRRQRFETEARAVAALNHPNIVAVYDVAFEDRTAFIVSELVQGETLRELIQRGPVPVRKVLDIAVQIADGLAAAHAAHVAHRDLKPENLMLTADGRLKILDFGLAKSISRPAAHPDATRTIASTQPGTIVGTASYMSPEQASGHADVDGRSDQFSLGLILHEMIGGAKAFERPTAAETMAAIIREDPAPLATPLQSPLRWTLDRCLAKEPPQRYDATRDLFLELRQLRDHASEITTASATGLAPAKPKRAWRFVLVALAGGLAAGVLFAVLWLEPPLTPARYIPFATEPGIQTMPAWSPAGDRIAYSAEVNGVFQIFARKVGSSNPSQITRQTASCFLPFWSPDGTRIYYILSRGSVDRSLWSSAVAGGAAEKILDGVEKAALSPDGKIMAVIVRHPDNTFSPMLSSPPGSTPHPFPQAQISQMHSAIPTQYLLQFTGDGRYLGIFSSATGAGEFWKIPLDGGAPQRELVRPDFGDPILSFNWLPDGNLLWSISDAGDSHIARTNLQGGADRPITAGVSQEKYTALSPDNRILAFQSGLSNYNLYEIPLNGEAAATVLATDRDEVAPSWAPDGVHFAYITNRTGAYEIWLRSRADGSERMVVSTRDFPRAASTDAMLDCAISPDGSRVAYRYAKGNPAIWISSLSGDAPTPLYDDPQVWQRGPSWSPDGNWIAYYSTYNGKPAVMKVQVGARHAPELVAYADDSNPVRWSPRGDWIAWDDGSKLALASPDGKQKRIVSPKRWLTYGWSKDGSSLFGMGVAASGHLAVQRIDPASGSETLVTDLGPAPGVLDLAQFQSDFPYRGFSLSPDGKSFLTSALGIQGDIWLMEDFDHPVGLLDRLLRRR